MPASTNQKRRVSKISFWAPLPSDLRKVEMIGFLLHEMITTSGEYSVMIKRYKLKQDCTRDSKAFKVFQELFIDFHAFHFGDASLHESFSPILFVIAFHRFSHEEPSMSA